MELQITPVDLEDLKKKLQGSEGKITLHFFIPHEDERGKMIRTFGQTLANEGLVISEEIHPEVSEETVPFLAFSAGDPPRHFYQAIPHGPEEKPFGDLLTTLISGKISLLPTSLRILEKVKKPLTIKILITPSCPFCGQMVTLVNRLAAASPLISTWIIDLELFPECAQPYRPKAAPTTILEEEVLLTGLIMEKELLDWVVKLDSGTYLEALYRNNLLEKRMDALLKRLSRRPQDLRILADLLLAEEFGIKLGAMAVFEHLIEDAPQLHGTILDHLLPLLQNKSDQVVGDTAYLVGQVRDERKTTVLTGLLSHPNPEVVEAARDGLALT